MNDEIMTGRNTSADQALARDLGVKLSPEQDEVTPLAAIGPAGYTVDVSGKPVDAPTIARMFDNKPYIDTYNELEPIEQHAFRQGVLMIKAQLVGTKDFDAAQATYEYLWKNRKTAGK